MNQSMTDRITVTRLQLQRAERRMNDVRLGKTSRAAALRQCRRLRRKLRMLQTVGAEPPKKDSDHLHQVFISYSRKDAEIANAIVDALNDRNIPVWFDQDDAELGQPIADQIQAALNRSDAMILLISPNAFSSSWVRNEFEHALFDNRYKEKVFPVLLSDDSRESNNRLPWFVNKLTHLRVKSSDSPRQIGITVANSFVKQFSTGATK